MTNEAPTTLNKAQLIFLFGLIIWILAQLIRFIAIPLITSAANGIDAPGWMYPAILDVVTAVFAIPLAFAVWKWRNFTSWTLTFTYLTLSITDHIGALTNLSLIGEPIAFERFTNGGNPFTAPVIQTTLDVLFFVMLMLPGFRSIFFKVQAECSVSS
ncbi:hypothetical protein [Thalassobius sp. MITS945101]|uniref:hypothetical protein n=1 Tax=Thalassobius sp. MITS945101 TaxID=3096994 RepID=UPI003999FD1C